MASAKLLAYLRAGESDLRFDNKQSLKNRPFSDPAFKSIQSERQSGAGQYTLADVLPRGPQPKTQSISMNALEATSVPYEYRPSIHPRLAELERSLQGPPAIPKCYTRDQTNMNEISVPYDTVIWDQPEDAEADLWFVKKEGIRGKGVHQKLVRSTVLYDYTLPPVVYGIKEPPIGNRLLEARDSRLY